MTGLSLTHHAEIKMPFHDDRSTIELEEMVPVGFSSLIVSGPTWQAVRKLIENIRDQAEQVLNELDRLENP